MTRLDADPSLTPEGSAKCDGPRLHRLELRDVPLGGIRAMHVRRALPQRELPMVGAWCFLDRFGPQRTEMRVEPHPHIGLQTVTWPIEGEIRHRDSVGSDVEVRRGALNLMTSGEGIAHSEYSLGERDMLLDALQLWVALPEDRRHGDPAFEQHAQLPTVSFGAPGSTAASAPSGEATVVLGTLAGVSSPASVYTPIVGAEIRIDAGAHIHVPLVGQWEHALLLTDGDATVIDDRTGTATDADAHLSPDHLLFLGTGRDDIRLASRSGARLFLIGGEPFADEIIMWWNFVGRHHDEIVAARDAWEAGAARFGAVIGHGPERVPAPPLPAVRLTKRRRRL